MRSFPSFPEKIRSPSVVTARAALNARGTLNQFENIPVPKTAILCMHPEGTRYYFLKFGNQRIKGFLGNFHILHSSDHTNAVLWKFGLGSASIAILTEELSALGIRRVIILGTAGSLQPGMNVGDIVLCDAAVRDEGVSHHYLSPEKFSYPSKNLLSEISDLFHFQNMEFTRGKCWSTDAPYRETAQEISYYQQEGVKVVDMESAALFAVGQVLNMETSSILIVGDHLTPEGWSSPSNLRNLHKKIRSVLQLLIRL